MSAELAVMKAIIETLRADPAVTALAAGKVYDKVSVGAARPYIHIRTLQAVEDGADCIDGQEIFIDIDVWSSQPGKGEAGQIASAVRKALNGASLSLDEPVALVDIEHRDTAIDDGGAENLTRARMTFRALVESV